MVWFGSQSSIFQSPGGYQGSPPPMSRPPSRPPTRSYDRLSQVLVVSKNDDILKFMKMHLNRYFSHVQVNKSYSDSYAMLKEKRFDVVIAEATRSFKPTLEFIRKVGQHWRSIPIVIIDPANDLKPDEFSGGLVIDVITPPFELDAMHLAIRRSLNVRSSLRELDPLLPPKSDFADVIRNTQLPNTDGKTSELIEAIRKFLTEEIVD